MTAVLAIRRPGAEAVKAAAEGARDALLGATERIARRGEKRTEKNSKDRENFQDNDNDFFYHHHHPFFPSQSSVALHETQ